MTRYYLDTSVARGRLDAIHLATALAMAGDLVVISHDTNLKRVAGLLGLMTYDPLDAG